MDMYKTSLFPYVEGGTLVGRSVTLTMTSVITEQLPDHQGKPQTKYVLHFRETKKGLILNKTNAKVVIGLYGRDTDGWTGQKITLYSEEVKAFGKLHNAARVRAPDQGSMPPNDGTDPLEDIEEEVAELGAEAMDELAF
jgi:hypothetical protein